MQARGEERSLSGAARRGGPGPRCGCSPNSSTPWAFERFDISRSMLEPVMYTTNEAPTGRISIHAPTPDFVENAVGRVSRRRVETPTG